VSSGTYARSRHDGRKSQLQPLAQRGPGQPGAGAL